MSQLYINIIGAGSLGQTLAKFWHQSGAFKIGGVVNRSLQSAQQAVEWMGCGEATEQLEDLRPADYWMLSASDAALAEITQQLIQADILKQGDLVFHCSGLASIEVFKPLEEKGILVGSLHPMMSFSSKERALAALKGILCGIEGNSDVFQRLSLLVNAFSGVPMVVSAQNKPLYHAMAVFASNYWVTLSHLAQQCSQLAGLDTAFPALAPLLQVTLENVMEKGPVVALSGPIARGDVAFVRTQYQAIQQASPSLAKAYAQLGLLTIDCVQENPRFSESMAEELRGGFI